MKGFIIGAGVTGLAAGISSGFPILESAETPGGICSSYYMVPGTNERFPHRPTLPCYRFEVGGGHWIFGGDPSVLAFLRKMTPVREYHRKSSVYFSLSGEFIPYPLQDHIDLLKFETTAKIRHELEGARGYGRTMKEWLLNNFGPTLCDVFFFPFHDLYTASLYSEIAPQDPYKTVVPNAITTQQAKPMRGYNPTYLYPGEGLDCLAAKMAAQSHIHYNCRVVDVNLSRRELTLVTGDTLRYEQLISTIPLSSFLKICGLDLTSRPDPYTSVLVLNIGAHRGPRCPEDHWIYTMDTVSCFHRVGFYSNVEPSFAPATDGSGRVSVYVERAFPGGLRPTESEVSTYQQRVISELQTWGFIRDVEIADPTWIDVAYTWTWPGSLWKKEALTEIYAHGVHCVGRYARWSFQGIADSIRDGMYVGAAAGGMLRNDS